MRTSFLLLLAILVCSSESHGQSVAKMKRLPDIVMVDENCGSMVSTIGGDKVNLHGGTSTGSLFCWRKGETLSCDFKGEDAARTLVFDVLEQAPRMFLKERNSNLTIIADWSKGGYALVQTYSDPENRVVFTKQCAGLISSGRALLDGSR